VLTQSSRASQSSELASGVEFFLVYFYAERMALVGPTRVFLILCQKVLAELSVGGRVSPFSPILSL
jgi:hypothetical protein